MYRKIGLTPRLNDKVGQAQSLSKREGGPALPLLCSFIAKHFNLNTKFNKKIKLFLFA
jgi:hypothetical protein